MTDDCDISSKIALRWRTSRNHNDDKSTLVQVMAWCRQARSHYLNQCWPRSSPPYGVTRPQWVNDWTGDSGSVLIRPILWTNDDKAARCHMAPHGHSRFTFSKTFSHRQDSFQFYINIIIRSPGKAIPQNIWNCPIWQWSALARGEGFWSSVR